MKRKPDIVILSDVHLGTHSCHAEELLQYLNSIEPKTLILNGDFFDIPQFGKPFFPSEHMEVVQAIFNMSMRGIKVYYITGNHDDALRRFSDYSAGQIQLRNKLIFHLNGKKYWIFHGDVLDLLRRQPIWLARFGGKGYDWVLRINRMINKWRERFGKTRKSFSKRIQQQQEKAASLLDQFENTALQLAARQGYDYVICGHTHRPTMRVEPFSTRSVSYLNSGDWVENQSALEYKWGNWTLFQFDEQEHLPTTSEKPEPEQESDDLSPQLKEFIFEQVIQRPRKKATTKY
jgi:UDP-2,3-diacylglucosamine pyrophosphatase LpxH